ncbi:MAG: transposase [Terrimicrobiaceae bacterium]
MHYGSPTKGELIVTKRRTRLKYATERGVHYCSKRWRTENGASGAGGISRSLLSRNGARRSARGDRATFVRTLAEASERSGFRIHAFALMSNHYHLLLETPQANLSRRMGWLQNAFNTRHGLWGHLFGGRHKAILAEPGNCFWALLDYIHLNPVRARIVAEKDGLESYVWSSLPHYLGPARKRPPWLETATGFEVCGCDDTASGRQGVSRLVGAASGLAQPPAGWHNVSRGQRPAAACGVFQPAAGMAVRFGALSRKVTQDARQATDSIEKANGYHGPQLNDYAEKRAWALIRAGLEHFGTDLATLRRSCKGDWRKRLLAAMIQKETTMRLDWITDQLNMGTRAGLCRLAGEARRRLATDRTLRRQMETISNPAILNG